MNCPNGWPTWRIEECCDILDNRRIPVNSEERENRIGDIPYYGANGLQGYIDDFIFDESLILIAEDGGRFDEFATRPIAYRISGKSWVNNHAHVLRAKKGFSQDAIFYALEHKDIQPFIVGGTRSKLNQSALRSITICLPEQESEQDKIAEILSTVNQAIEQNEALIAKQQRIKTGLMQDLLTRGIDEDPSQGWSTWRIEECCDILDNRRIPVNSEEREKRIGDIPYYGANGLQGYIDDFIFDEPLILIAEDGGRFDEFATRSIAYRISGKSWVNNHAHVLRAKKGFSQDAIFYALEHKDIQPFIVGGTRSKLNQSALRSITVSLPEQESEQDKIAEILSMVDLTIEHTKALMAKQLLIKISLMQDLLTCKVRVTPLLAEVEARS